ncbi:hypothetical protein [Candidatus Nanopusillus massiliensis]|uniref:hypothetical protein n=1 Tax=Candidatus Nanopusillus massiliensis TaxID=2897163 RepID=UPI001E4BB7FF|nr:hypothetical protein [Candidatus Nanopusillus massiliensis]
MYQSYDDEDGTPIRGGLMDLRLGVVDPSYVCETCGKTAGKCLGHFGHIESARPVLHPEFLPIVKELVNAVCHNCGHVKLRKEEREFALNKIEKYKNAKRRNKLYKFIVKFVYSRAKKSIQNVLYVDMKIQKLNLENHFTFSS